jgi:hypothetical protein
VLRQHGEKLSLTASPFQQGPDDCWGGCAHLHALCIGRRIRFGRCIACSLGQVLFCRPAGHARRAARAAKRLPEKILDLSVQAAQIIVRPALNALEYRGVDAKEEGFPFRHVMKLIGEASRC